VKLVIFHYHLRPGGVRRVIELAAPHIVRAFEGGITGVVLASGDGPDRNWQRLFTRAVGDVPVEFFIEPAFGYFSEQRRSPATLRPRIQRALRQLLIPAASNDAVVWAHNLGLARNLILTQELTRACEARGLPLLAHHHDWWFDNRWQRWSEVRRAGFRSLNAIAQAIFGSTHARHLAINHADAVVLKRRLRVRVNWLPNLAPLAPPPPPARARFARAWLRHRLDHDGPVWLLPCRLLRRKNVAEALLLTRWLRPDAWLVTTGGVSSEDEQAYFKKLDAAARAHHWRLRLGVLAGDETRKPTVGELLAASEAVLLTSLQEGFGLPFLEAAAARRPLIARALPNIAPDLARFGFRFPQHYAEIRVDAGLFDWKAERARQTKLFRVWLERLPRSLHGLLGRHALLASRNKPTAVPFSRLTLTAQLEVLAEPATHSWELCLPLNPFLIEWRRRAGKGRLRVTQWPRNADRWLSGEAYARRFREALGLTTHPPSSGAARERFTGAGRESAIKVHPLTNKQQARALATQTDFIHLKLAARQRYPLLWSSDA